MGVGKILCNSNLRVRSLFITFLPKTKDIRQYKIDRGKETAFGTLKKPDSYFKYKNYF